MSGIYIPNMKMPTRCCECRLSTSHSFQDRPLCDVLVEYMSYGEWETKRLDNCPLVPAPEHGRLIDADALRAKMYHEAFETDTDMQKWDSGCWIRYKMFEQMEKAAQTIIPEDKGGEG